MCMCVCVHERTTGEKRRADLSVDMKKLVDRVYGSKQCNRSSTIE